MVKTHLGLETDYFDCCISYLLYNQLRNPKPILGIPLYYTKHNLCRRQTRFLDYWLNTTGCKVALCTHYSWMYSKYIINFSRTRLKIHPGVMTEHIDYLCQCSAVIISSRYKCFGDSTINCGFIKQLYAKGILCYISTSTNLWSERNYAFSKNSTSPKKLLLISFFC